jgi:leucyl aminopeptidase (aminopeptidase T)
MARRISGQREGVTVKQVELQRCARVALEKCACLKSGERVFGWTHVSTGSNATFPGGTVHAKIHLDGIISQPTIYLDDKLILQDGQFQGVFA